jgi:hypothetical protein
MHKGVHAQGLWMQCSTQLLLLILLLPQGDLAMSPPNFARQEASQQMACSRYAWEWQV